MNILVQPIKCRVVYVIVLVAAAATAMAVASGLRNVVCPILCNEAGSHRVVQTSVVH